MFLPILKVLNEVKERFVPLRYFHGYGLFQIDAILQGLGVRRHFPRFYDHGVQVAGFVPADLAKGCDYRPGLHVHKANDCRLHASSLQSRVMTSTALWACSTRRTMRIYLLL